MSATYYYRDLPGGYDYAAQSAINRSVIHDEIVVLVADDDYDRRAIIAALRSLAEDGQDTDSVETGDTTEVWAYDSAAAGNGSMVWRVHVRAGTGE